MLVFLYVNKYFTSQHPFTLVILFIRILKNHAQSLTLLVCRTMTTKKEAMRKAPVVSIEKIKEVNGNIIGGKLTTENGQICKLYAYTLPTFELLKKQSYQEVLL